MMEVQNAKNRSSENREDSNIGNSKSASRVMGTLSSPSAEHGTYKIRIGGEDSQQGNTNIAGEQSSHGIPGKIVSQLVNETEKQLAYHKEQVELLEERLKELKQYSEEHADL